MSNELAYLLVTGIIGIGALIVNQRKSPSTKNKRMEDMTRGPMDLGTEAWIKTRYQYKVSEARKALADRAKLADGWARYV